MLRLPPSFAGLRNALIRNTYTKLHLVYRKQLLFTNGFLLSARKSQGTASVVGKMIARTALFDRSSVVPRIVRALKQGLDVLGRVSRFELNARLSKEFDSYASTDPAFV
jgi:hypothetical protein